MIVTEFTPLSATIGGVLIGIAAVLLMTFEGRIAGISGIVGRLFPPFAGSDALGAAAFLLGLITAPLAYDAAASVPFTQTVSSDVGLMAAAGLLVGFGATLGGGCTSGHGVCGLARLSFRSLVATATFMVAGFVTVFVLRHLIGG